MTKAGFFIEKGKCKNNQCSLMSKSAWCDLYSKGDIIGNMISAIILNINNRKKLFLLQDNFKLKAMALNIP